MSGHGKEAVRLCERIVCQSFGLVVARVASTLLNRGRLPVPAIARLAGMSPMTVMASLLILMQHSLVQSSGASTKDTGEEEEYEFVPQECMLRLRWGRILTITAERYDNAAVEVVRQIMLYGHLPISELISACGDSSNTQKSEAIIMSIITLLQNNFLCTTDPDQQILESEHIARRFAQIKRRTAQSKGSSLLSANDIQNCLLEATHETRVHLHSVCIPSRALIKREKMEKEKKNRKKTNQILNQEEYSYDLKKDIHIRINYDRYGVLIRNGLIAKAAEDRWNQGAGIVMRAALEASLSDTSSLSDDRTHDPVSLNSILPKIPPSSGPLLLAGISASSKTSVPDLVRSYLSMMAGEDHSAGTGVTFLSREGSTNPMYRIEIENICAKLREGVVMDMVREKLGDKAARVLEVVRRSAKAFETTIRDCAMLPLSTARFHLASLQRLSLIETQEVPKTGAKINPSKGRPVGSVGADYHLWAVDMPRVYSVVLSGVYKTLGNILQRRHIEIERRRLVLAREDRVKLCEGGRGLLQLKDQEELAELDDALNKLTLAELRSELVVFVLRDLPGWPGKI
ncbi:uncharacterized protein L203_103833 [Cryptococcus depauperatus CBS 7841]|uniref:DNA-directed RNA polymerase III subunit RPC3 n=1 Tax=Cryptococcus depauperatus CBS 7841 TaxID=1295531 RepID=A0A1E3IE79_9TREE|nr:DNA-directed RNA polymerase III subunit RPC3 [Cryptococcus depauperatus CBS 7841]